MLVPLAKRDVFTKFSLACLCVMLAIGLFAGRAYAIDTILFSDNFEAGLTGWTLSGRPTLDSGGPKIDAYAVKLPKNSSIQRIISTLGWREVTVSFWLAANLRRSGANLQAHWFDGSTWILLKQFNTGDSDADGQLHFFEFALPTTAFDNSRFALRFRLNSKDPRDVGYVDNVMVRASNRFTYTLNLSGINGSVKINGVSQTLPWSGSFEYGTIILLQAVPDNGFHFTGWDGSLTGSDNPATILMDNDKDITAIFAVDIYQLSVSTGTGHGSVKVNGVLQTLPWIGAFNRGETVQLEAIPEASYHFTGWAGALTGSVNPSLVTMDSDKSVSAGFTSDTYALHLTGIGNGGVKINGVYHNLPDVVTIPYNNTVILESAPAVGWHFIGWDDDLSGITDPVQIIVDSDKSVTVLYEINSYELDLTGIGNGTIKVDGEEYLLPWLGFFTYGDIVTVEAVPAAGSHFVSWYGDLSGAANPTVIVIDNTKNVICNFALNVYTLTLNGTNGTVKVNGIPRALPWTGSFDNGEQVSLEAAPVTGFQFDSWSGDLISPENPTLVTMDGDKIVTAQFVVETHALSITGTNGLLVIDGVIQVLPYLAYYDYGASVTLEAIPDPCMRFAGWSGDLIGRENPVTITMDSGVNITVEFITIVVFPDVACDFWAAAHIAACFYEGIVSGYPDGTYQPTWPVSRDQMAVYVSRALAGGDVNIPTGPAQPSFSDVPTNHWAYRYIEFAAINVIVTGYPEGDYKPDVALDRGQMAVFIARAIATPSSRPDISDYTPPAIPTFPDVNTDFWAYRFIEYIADASRAVTQGYPDGLYHHEYPCTRDQMAVYMARAFQLPM